MKMELNLRVTQTVTPQMILSMTMLQYSASELEEYLSELSYENPLMEIERPEPTAKNDQFVDLLKWLKSKDRQNKTYYPDCEDSDFVQRTFAPDTNTLSDYLHQQLLTMSLSKELLSAAKLLCQLLDSRGFYDGDISEVARLSGCTPETAQKALALIKTLDPPGVGARDIPESLLLQLQRMEHRVPLAELLVREHYRHLATWPLKKLSAAVDSDPESVARAKALICTLGPYPGDGFSVEESIHYIRPDILITEENGQFLVLPIEETVSRVSINSEYLKLLETESDPEVQKYLKGKLSQLEQVMKNLQNRSSTILRCADIVVRHQEEYFRGGSLKKMTLRDVAAEMGVHESTVSRTARGKYIQSPRGVIEMIRLFSRDAGQNIGVSREHIKDRIRALIAEEDPKKPLSDEKLIGLLSEDGILISRRTAAKYRMELGILPASARKAQTTV